jgi:predicted Holliday junction resolvase-like endonuclease
MLRLRHLQFRRAEDVLLLAVFRRARSELSKHCEYEASMSIQFIVLGVLAIVIIVFAAYRVIELRAQLKFERWKAEHTQSISRDAIKGSQAVVTGRVFERVAAYLPGFGYNPKDARFIGDPVDFVVFDGLSEGSVRKVVFVEVKTGNADLNGNERKVKGAVTERRVEWALYRAPNENASMFAVDSAADVIVDQLDASVTPRSTLRERGRF